MLISKHGNLFFAANMTGRVANSQASQPIHSPLGCEGSVRATRNPMKLKSESGE
jgi:hypothetical protein